MTREKKFLRFCSRALGTLDESPLKDVNGALANALIDAFEKTHPRKFVPKSYTVQAFEDAIYREPFCCYVIRNRITTSAYVGCSKAGFLKRYERGEWWKFHHNDALSRDALVFGITNFTVHIYVCIDEQDMLQREAELMRSHRLYTYNIRPEPD